MWIYWKALAPRLPAAWVWGAGSPARAWQPPLPTAACFSLSAHFSSVLSLCGKHESTWAPVWVTFGALSDGATLMKVPLAGRCEAGRAGVGACLAVLQGAPGEHRCLSMLERQLRACPMWGGGWGGTSWVSAPALLFTSIGSLNGSHTFCLSHRKVGIVVLVAKIMPQYQRPQAQWLKAMLILMFKSCGSTAPWLGWSRLQPGFGLWLQIGSESAPCVSRFLFGTPAAGACGLPLRVVILGPRLKGQWLLSRA